MSARCWKLLLIDSAYQKIDLGGVCLFENFLLYNLRHNFFC